jgi:hypothetical protein
MELENKREKEIKKKKKNKGTPWADCLQFGPFPHPYSRRPKTPHRARAPSLSVAWGRLPVRIFSARVSLMGGPGSSEAPSPS